MKVSLNWLKEYLDFDLAPGKLAEVLEMSGTAVEALESLGKDTIFDLEITPNRPDCLGVIGVAREVAAILRSQRPEVRGQKPVLKIPEIKLREGKEKTSTWVKVEVKEPQLCPRYAARVITGVKVGASPEWLKTRLEKAGLRSLNNVVDITNYMMLETGQPLHAFDYDLIKEGKIFIRRALEKEKLVTLDGVERKLGREMLVIADGKDPIALGGIMGGLYTEVSLRTSTIFLESANFNPRNIMRTSRSLGVSTESSLRFEKGIDPNGVSYALDRAAELIQELARGKVLKGALDIYPQELKPKTLTLKIQRVNEILGTDLTNAQVRKILEALELKVETPKTPSSKPKVTIPTFRQDLEREVDLIEEVARLYGFEKIPTTLPKSEAQGGLDLRQKLDKKIRELLVSSGLFEVINYSFMGLGKLKRLNISPNTYLSRGVALKNPLTEEQAMLRTTLIPGLLETIKLNQRRGNPNVQVFEIGRAFYPQDKSLLPKEEVMIGLALTGSWQEDEWYQKSEALDFFDLKGLIEFLFKELDLKKWVLKSLKLKEYPFLHPARSTEILMGDEKLGFLGELHPEVGEALELEKPVLVGELSEEKLFSHVSLEQKFKELPKFPAATLDLAVVMSEEVENKKVEKIIKKYGDRLLTRIHLFDLYRGKQVGPNKKSLAYSLTFRAPHRTLLEEEVKKIYQKIVEALQKELKAEIRT